MIRFVTDSASMIPPTLRDRFDVIVVPMTVTIDGEEYHEGLDLTSADFYARLAAGATVTTSAPSPGAILTAYQLAASTGAAHVLSIHTGSNYSATVSAANIASELADVTVSVIDTKLASFAVTFCLWAAADAIAVGRSITVAADAARSTAALTGSVFVVGVPELTRRGGRFVSVAGEILATSVLELDGNGLHVMMQVDDIDDAVEVMTSHARVLAGRQPMRVGIGDALRPNIAAALANRLADTPGIVEIIRYEVGPSVGAHTGAGTVGIVYAPVRF